MEEVERSRKEALLVKISVTKSILSTYKMLSLAFMRIIQIIILNNISNYIILLDY